ncbi:MAG: helix-turn-helix domain-containing protein, partial [Candidatus Rokuibacteriota bacterium]
MRSLGAYLRERREGRGLSLEELARATRVAPRYLEALEADDLQALPPPVFARGFVRVCCQVLQAPVDEALALYHGQTGAPPPTIVEGTALRHVAPETRSSGTVLVSFVLLVVLGLALFAVTLALQSSRDSVGERVVRVGDGEPAPSGPAPPAAVLDGPGPADAGPATVEL